MKPMEYRCAECGWTGPEDAVDWTPAKDQICPVCASDELEIVPLASREDVRELARVWGVVK